MPTFWLSFVDDNLPVGDKFLGVVITDEDTFVSAVQKTHRLGINPGGEVAGGDLRDDHPYTIAEKDRLIAKIEATILANRV